MPANAYGPPMANAPQPMPGPSKTATIDHETLQRFKDMELNHSVMASTYEKDIRDLHSKIETLQLELATKESVVSQLRMSNEQLSMGLAREQSARQQDRVEATRMAQKQIDTQVATQVAAALAKQPVPTLSPPQSDVTLQKLLDQLQVERANNKQFSIYLQQLQSKHEDQIKALKDQTESLRSELDEEKKANGLLHDHLDELVKNPPVAAPSLANTVDIKELEQAHTQLEQERKEYEKKLQVKQLEVNSLYKQIDDQRQVVACRLTTRALQAEAIHAQEQSKNEISELKLKMQQMTNTSISAQQQLDVEVAKGKEAVRKFVELQRQFSDFQAHYGTLQQQLQSTARQLVDTQNQLALLASADPSAKYDKNTLPSLGPTRSKPPQGYDLDIYAAFSVGDATNTGKLDAMQLKNAIARGPWPPLTLKTCWMLLRIADSSAELCSLDAFPTVWNWVQSCKECFEKYDHSRQSPTVWGFATINNPQDLDDMLAVFGIRVHKSTLPRLIKRMALLGVQLTWDKFVGLFTTIKVWTIEFQKEDIDADRTITITMAQYYNLLSKCI
ncbi:peflin or Penta-EF hand domain-containing protein 1 [Kappamyces sp. JEL0680]|nr:peflin or Penta-EF hand domain-containing protein 1 [Kappamyces sp. JEL0680]